MSSRDATEPPYDPELRRDTPLARKLAARIRRDGPISVADYMHACLQDPEHGYYRARSAIGAAGDFVTAPEISQCFGELIGLWCAVVWQQMGAPSRFNLVELGPGRGTLMADALRAAKVVPGFLDAARVVLVESNATLRQSQRQTLAATALQTPPVWADGFADLPHEHPSIVVGNEFVDTFAVDQRVVSGTRVRPRRVGLDDDERLCFLPADDGAQGSAVIVETPRYQPLLGLRRALAGRPSAVLLIDYGYVWELDGTPPHGETLQAVREHRAEHPLTSPGEADLTAHVDFTTLAGAFTCTPDGLAPDAVDGPVPQANFLGALGIMQRASRLMAANPARAHEIETGVARLMAVPGMGDRFKVLGARSPDLPPLPGF